LGKTPQVKEILDDTRLLAVCMNSHKLGQRKNCNLPGVVSDLPVLGPKDIDDVKNFAAAHGMDYVFASFVQCAEDVRMIRKVREGGRVCAHVCTRVGGGGGGSTAGGRTKLQLIEHHMEGRLQRHANP
jgi:pyruvate kinase